MDNIKLLNGDCLELMKDISSGSVDLILTDPPYGIIENLDINGYKNKDNSWDKRVDTKQLFSEFKRILRVNGKAIIFSQEPYTNELKNHTDNDFIHSYDLIWNKEFHANALVAKKKPLNIFEMISVFTKVNDIELTHPLREIAKEIMKKNNIKIKNDVNKQLNNTKMDHFFRINSKQFSLCSECGWNDFCKHYDDCGYTYQQLKKINEKYENTFNITEGNSEKTILTYKKENKRYHPTQKPVALLEHLVKMYSNKNDLIVDCFMGSGPTGVACKNLNRNFIGIELDKEYFKIAKERINDAK